MSRTFQDRLTRLEGAALLPSVGDFNSGRSWDTLAGTAQNVTVIARNRSGVGRQRVM